MGLAKPQVVCIIRGVGTQGPAAHNIQEVDTTVIDPASRKMKGDD